MFHTRLFSGALKEELCVDLYICAKIMIGPVQKLQVNTKQLSLATMLGLLTPEGVATAVTACGAIKTPLKETPVSFL